MFRNDGWPPLEERLRMSLRGGETREERIRLSPNYTVLDWNLAINTGPIDWGTAIRIASDRLAGRWLNIVDCIDQELNSGFAVLALDCIVLESLWGFINGKSAPTHDAASVYRDILTSARFQFSPADSEDFRQFVRNGIVHDAETRQGWLIERTVPRDQIIERVSDGTVVINRSKFHIALKGCFQDWIGILQSGDPIMRSNLRKRMDQIIRIGIVG